VRTQPEIRDWLLARVAKLSRMDSSRISTSEPLASYGVSSVRLIEMSGDLEDWLGRQVDPMVFWEHPTIDALAAHLSKG
jgi:myxalamid-type polyketide synthase MxaB